MTNIIFLINIKNPAKPNRTDMYDLSIKSWQHWAKKHSYSTIVLTEPVVDMNRMNPILMRHYVFDLLDQSNIDYEQIAMVDADTIVHPDCPDFFKISDNKFCAVHNDGDYDWVIRSIENYQYEFYGTDKCKVEDVWNYFNTGFMITNKNYRHLHQNVLDFYWRHEDKISDMQKRWGVGTDQPLLNMIVRNSTDVKVKLLPYQYNMQDLSRKNILDDRMLFTQIPGVYHFNAIPEGVEKVNFWMQKTYNYLYEHF
jgi:hypothetical protein